MLSQERPSLSTSVRRAVAGRCPNCGRGKLFASYLRPVERCADCGERYSHIRSDDAAPWLTILVVGHVIVPLMLTVEGRTDWPDWVAMTLWPALALGLAAIVLPRAKALFVAVIWATRAPGSERD